MRKAVFLTVVLLMVILTGLYYPKVVEKPVKDGHGPLAVQLDPRFSAPETHNPLYWWQAHHMDIVNRGDLEKVDCLYCHEPETSCNNCHQYVGVEKIVLP
jgi:hypothetical protein